MKHFKLYRNVPDTSISVYLTERSVYVGSSGEPIYAGVDLHVKIGSYHVATKCFGMKTLVDEKIDEWAKKCLQQAIEKKKKQLERAKRDVQVIEGHLYALMFK
jgi:hypothetical protein